MRRLMYNKYLVDNAAWMSLSVRGYNKMTLTDIWKIEDKNSLILALDEHVAEK